MKTPKSSLRALLTLSAIFGATHIVSAAPATDSWTGNSGANWSSPGNWTGGNAPPQAGDSLLFNSSSGSTTLNNDLTAGTAIDGITFGGSGFTLNGNSVLLSGNAYSNFIGVTNTSGTPQTVNLNLSLDWGSYTFTGGSTFGLGLNGTLNPSSNGVAFFDANVTSSSLAPDSTGLISGLGGQGLMFSAGAPTGLATISGTGPITAYSAFTPVASGAITSGANNNISLTASGAATAFSDNGATVNTITAIQAGNAGGTATDTLTTTGTLTLGQHGGIYALSTSSTFANLLTVTGGNLTAGTAAGATIVFGTHNSAAGNSPPNVMTVSSVIKDIPGGSVSVVKVGNSSMVINGANTYSGGTYIAQGQIQIGANATALGTGPIYIAPGATLLNNVTPSGSETILNNIFISSGNGSALWNGTALNPGAFVYCFADGNFFFNGVFTLMGAPVPSAAYPPTAGCRIIGNKDAGAFCIFQNQITGTGTLDLCTGPHADFFEFSNNPNNHPANNWQGGLIIEEILASPSSQRNITVQLEFDNQIPNGANAGDVTLYNADASSFHSQVVLDLNGHTNVINGLNSSSIATLPILTNSSATASATLTVGSNNATGNYNGTIVDRSNGAEPFNLAKVGSGTETFTGPLTHHGSTTVSAGTFALGGSGSLANSTPITVASGAILDASGVGGLTVGASQTLNCVGTVVGNTTVNGTVMALDSIGTFNNNGSMTFNSGGSYVWDINDTLGTLGGDAGWSVLNINGSLTISSTTGTPFNIDITSLTAGDVAGSAAHFNPNINGSWIIAETTGGVFGFTGSGQFSISTSAFANAPASSAQWSVGVVGNNLVLFYTSTPAITTPLVSITNNAGTTATFTVVANGAATPITFNWFQGSTPLANGSDPSGSGATITITSVGHTSSLTIGGSGVQDADAGGYTVTVTNSSGASGGSSATLTVIDPPSNPNVTQSAQFQQAIPPVSAGAVDILTASASAGTQPFAYQWYLNGNAINGATGSVLNLDVSGSAPGNYTVVIGNAAGNVTNSDIVIGPVSVVPNQIIFEPFNYTQQSHNPSPPQLPWSAFGVTNLYNQATGNLLGWVNVGNNDFATMPSYNLADQYAGAANRPLATDEYPVSGLAGNDANCIYADSDVNGGQVNLPFGTGGTLTNGTVYFSTVIQLYGIANTAVTDYVFGLGSGSANSTTHSVGIYVQTLANEVGAFPNVPYNLGIFKGNLTTAQLNPGVNGNWLPNSLLDYNVLFIVGRLNYNNSPATCDLWVNPAPATFYASEANVPPADIANAGSGVADVAGGISLFFMKITTWPVDRYFGDVRIGTTWASVTPPSAPTLSLSDQVFSAGVPSVALVSQNAGNPVSTYQWQFGGGPALTDGPHYSGTGTGTLTIINPTAADVGLYTVTGSNTSPAPSDNSATLIGSASAMLTLAAPALSVTYSAPNVVLSWPTNFTGYVLEQTTAMNPSNWTTNSTTPTIVGNNYTVPVNALSGTKFFRLKK